LGPPPSSGRHPWHGNNPSTLVFRNFNTAAAVNALETQGKVEVISKHRACAPSNNQTALIKVGEDKPFLQPPAHLFSSPARFQPLTSENTVVSSRHHRHHPVADPADFRGCTGFRMDISPVLTSLG